MFDSIAPIFYIAMFVLAALWVAALVTQDRDRQVTFSKTAKRMGLRYEPSANELVEAYGILPLFGQGRDRITSNVIRGGSGDQPEAVFDFQYAVAVEGEAQDDKALRQTVAVFHLPGAHLPHFTLEPRDTPHPIEGMFGYGDIDFMHAPEFSRVYHLRGQDVVHVQQCFQPDVLTRLQQEPGWHVEGAADRLVIYHPAARVAPEELSAFIDGAVRITRAFRGA